MLKTIIIIETLALILVGAMVLVRYADPADASPSASLAADAAANPEKAQVPETIRSAPIHIGDPPLPALRNARILVEKGAGRLTVFEGDRRMKAYPIVSGANAGDKTREGDRRTPEGDFYICVKNPNSRFTLSMGISYPDVSDARRGLQEGTISQAEYDRIVYAIRRRTRPPWDTALGGEIMIHGGGVDRSGSLGCIGMSDEHIRELYSRIGLGTPVRIIP